MPKTITARFSGGPLDGTQRQIHYRDFYEVAELPELDLDEDQPEHEPITYRVLFYRNAGPVCDEIGPLYYVFRLVE